MNSQSLMEPTVHCSIQSTKLTLFNREREREREREIERVTITSTTSEICQPDCDYVCILHIDNYFQTAGYKNDNVEKLRDSVWQTITISNLQFWKCTCINIFLMRDAQIKCAGSPWRLNFERLWLTFLMAGVLSM